MPGRCCGGLGENGWLPGQDRQGLVGPFRKRAPARQQERHADQRQWAPAPLRGTTVHTVVGRGRGRREGSSEYYRWGW